MKTEHKKKVVVVGKFGVGKSSLIKQFVHSIFSEKYLSTIGVNIDKKTIEFPDDLVHLILWDLAGSSDNKSQSPMHLQGAQGIIFVCDLTRPSSYNNIEEQIQLLKKTTGDIPIVRVGNKSDLLSSNQLNSIKEQLKIDHISSAKLNTGVNELFLNIARKLI